MEKFTFIVQKSKKKKDPSASITLEGNLTIHNASAIQTKLVAIKNDFKKVELAIKNVTDIDLTVIQLISSYWNTMHKQKNLLEVKFEVSNEIKTLLTHSGFQELYKIYMN